MITGLAIGLIIGTIAGYTLCLMLTDAKKINGIVKSEDCNHGMCNKDCRGWNICESKWL